MPEQTTLPPVELLPPGEAVHGNERWYELRRQGVTASEIAIVMGISKRDSPFNLYWSKINDWRWEGNEYADTGRHLEPSIADWWFAECDPLENAQPGFAGLYAHSERSWQLATPDRLIYLTCAACDGTGFIDGERFCPECEFSGHGEKPVGLLECKWVAYSWDGWGEPGTDEIPVHYRAQCLWQADVMGVDEVHVAALGPGGFRAYRVQRDERGEADLELMRKEGEDFVRRLREQDPPDLDSHTATLGALKKLHPSVEDGEVEVPVLLAEAYRKARAEKAAAETAVDGIEARIRALLGSQRKAVCGGKTVASRSVFEQQRIDTKRLRVEQPKIAAEYTTTTTVDRLNPGRSKGDD